MEKIEWTFLQHHCLNKKILKLELGILKNFQWAIKNNQTKKKKKINFDPLKLKVAKHKGN
jgi:hypothetical protein